MTWPEATKVNPDLSPYTFEVHDTGPGYLIAVWGDQGRDPATVAPDGPHTMSFSFDGSSVIRLMRCTGDDEGCVEVASSPQLEVRRGLSVDVQQLATPIGPQRTAYYPVEIRGTGGSPAEIGWELRLKNGVLVATGDPVTLEPTSSASWGDTFQLPILVPSSVHTGTFDLVVTASVDREPFGHLTGASLKGTRTVSVDAIIQDPLVGKTPAKFYPQPDRYQDSIEVTFEPREVGGNMVVDVVDRDGKQVTGLYDSAATGGDVTWWDGTNRAGRIVKPGTYTLRFEYTDAAGNVALVTRDIVVSGQRVVEKTWTRTIAATDTVIGKTAGRCSTLATPARPGWKKSLGYHSFTRCRDGDQGVVATTNGSYVPASVTGHYRDMQVRVNGAAGAGSAGRAYLVLGYLRASDNSMDSRVTLYANGRDTGKSVDADRYIRDRRTKPYVAWTAGLTAGSRYDVRSFTLTITYKVLR